MLQAQSMGRQLLNYSSTTLAESVKSRFPLLDCLEFSETGGTGTFSKLPPLFGVLASLTNPQLSGDVCAVLPASENVASFVALLVALTAAASNVPALLKKYVQEGFQAGETVRVLPAGHVYRYGGYYDAAYGQFFKLTLLGGGAVSFPIDQAVRLEKTLKSHPIGRGNSKWGELQLSSLDGLIGTRTAGNTALLSNEVILVTAQNAFIELMENVHVRRCDRPNDVFALDEVIPWGTVDQDGDIEFRQKGTAAGEPIIAISSRPEWVATVCRQRPDKPPRVIVDGAARLRNLQVFDDLAEFGKLTVLANHAELSLLRDLSLSRCRFD